MVVSKNGVAVIAMLLAILGLDVPEQAVNGAWEGIVAIISLILMIWNQLTRLDVYNFLFKK